MKSIVKVVALLAVTFAGFGCVAQSEVDDLQAALRRSEEQVIELRSRLEEANARMAAYEGARGSEADIVNRLSLAQQENARLLEQLRALEERVRGMGGPLEPELDRALIELAQQYPDLMTYDSQRGMIKFQSDLTFALGSAQVNERARTSLARLAEIVRQPVASRYEVRVVGHTDNVPVRNAANVAKYGDNWGLSAARAIAVMQVLRQAGVPEARIGIAGYGEHRPVAPNAAAAGGRGGGAAANRRVEIYLVPLVMPDVQAQAQPGQGAQPPAAAPQREAPEPPETFK